MTEAPEPNPICEAEGHDWVRAILRERCPASIDCLVASIDDRRKRFGLRLCDDALLVQIRSSLNGGSELRVHICEPLRIGLRRLKRCTTSQQKREQGERV